MTPLLPVIVVGGITSLSILALSPEVATVLVVTIIFTNAAVIAVNFHGVPFIIGAAVPLLLVIPFIYYVLIQRRPFVITPALKWLVLFLFTQIIAALFSRDSGTASQAVLSFVLEGLAIFILLTNTIRTPAMIRAVVWSLLVSGALLGGLSGYQQLTQTYDNDYLGFAQVSRATLGTGETTIQGEVDQPRLAGPIGEKNFYAEYMLVLIPLGLMRIWAERRPLLKLAAGAVTSLVMVGVALTFSRGAMLALVVVLALMLAMRYIRPYQLLIGATVLVVAAVAVPAYASRIASLDALSALLSDNAAESTSDKSILSRATENAAAALVFIDHPIIGVGPGLFPTYYQVYAEQVGIDFHGTDRESHNLYLGLGAEDGVIGLIAFLAVFAVTIRDLRRAERRWRKERPELAQLAAGFVLSLVAYLTSSLFLHLAYERYVWLFLALAAATATVLCAAPASEPVEMTLRDAAAGPRRRAAAR